MWNASRSFWHPASANSPKPASRREGAPRKDMSIPKASRVAPICEPVETEHGLEIVMQHDLCPSDRLAAVSYVNSRGFTVVSAEIPEPHCPGYNCVIRINNGASSTALWFLALVDEGPTHPWPDYPSRY